MWRKFEPGHQTGLSDIAAVALVSFDGERIGKTDIANPDCDVYYLVAILCTPHIYHIITDLQQWIHIDIRAHINMKNVVIQTSPLTLNQADLSYLTTAIRVIYQSGMMTDAEYMDAFYMAEACVDLLEDGDVFRDEEEHGLSASEAPPVDSGDSGVILTTPDASDTTGAKGSTA